MSQACIPRHDWFTATLTFGLCCGLIISYAPQHFRIINKGSSEGFSPWFLWLGSMSSAAGMLNMVTMQWGIVKCCRVFSLESCIEMTAGVVQVGLQWLLFNIIFVLYMIYYPQHLKHVNIDVATHDAQPPRQAKGPYKSQEWRLSIILFWTMIIHLIFSIFTTLFLLLTVPLSLSPASRLPPQISAWATFLGTSSALLAAIQYAPQIVHTYKAKLVGAISIPMMLIQSPGAVFMVLSIALRPGTNWTSWITFAVSGMMQGSLLVMCIVWKYRQHRLGIDDFGNLLGGEQQRPAFEDGIPGWSTETENPTAVRVALTTALESPSENDVWSADIQEVNPLLVGEETPLLGLPTVNKEARGRTRLGNWFRREGS